MNEDEAWGILDFYASRARVSVTRAMPVSVIRRTLAKVYQPRKATDDDSSMRRINSAIDIVGAERDRRELCGMDESAAPAKPQPRPPGVPPWQTEPTEPSQILRNDYTDLNYIKKTVYERSVRFGDVELVKAWAWDGQRFRKVVSAYANMFAYEDLGRALLVLQSADGGAPCDAVLLSKGTHVTRSFRLIIARMGRSFENVNSYNLTLECELGRPDLAEFLADWLQQVRAKLVKDRAAH
jgi:hypothetical protein